MIKLLGLPAVVALALSLSGHNHQLCEGIVPENDLYIPPSEVQAFNLSESDFNSALDRVEKIYQPIIAQQGGNLNLRRLWDDGTVNASAMRYGSTWVVNMYGGLARHSSMTIDGFLLVACHEVGHHIGGAPKIGGWMNRWASNEGQSDYYAGYKCFTRLYSDEENMEWLSQATVDPLVEDKCTKAHGNQAAQASCMRFAMAGWAVTDMFRNLKEEWKDFKLDFATPDTKVVSRTYQRHPEPQCRLDTYFHSALCNKDKDSKSSNSNPALGTCTRSGGYSDGVRPLCWYKP